MFDWFKINDCSLSIHKGNRFTKTMKILSIGGGMLYQHLVQDFNGLIKYLRKN